DLDQVPVLQGPAVGDPVADHLVDGGADGLGEGTVAQGRRVGAVVQHVLVGDGIQLVRGDPGGDGLGGLLHRVVGDPAGLAHRLDHRGRLHVGALVGLRCGTVDVLGAHDGLRDVTTRADAVRGNTA